MEAASGMVTGGSCRICSHDLEKARRTLAGCRDRRSSVTRRRLLYWFLSVRSLTMNATRLLLAVLVAFGATGCTAFDRTLHDLKPHRLWRLNRYDAPGREDANFYSVRDHDAEDAVAATDEVLR